MQRVRDAPEVRRRTALNPTPQSRAFDRPEKLRVTNAKGVARWPRCSQRRDQTAHEGDDRDLAVEDGVTCAGPKARSDAPTEGRRRDRRQDAASDGVADIPSYAAKPGGFLLPSSQC